ncbi:MAG: M20 family metallopeptidase [Candidatus Bipolaricaulia bacterium]
MKKQRETVDVDRYIDGDELVDLTQDLIRIPSVYRSQTRHNEEQVARFVAEWLTGIGVEPTFEQVTPSRPNVIAVLEGSESGPCLMFECHTDVVTEGDRSEWTHGPFDAEVADGRIYGRGACDTKGNLAAALIAVKAIVVSKLGFNGRILLGILVDEEGMMAGVKDFIRRGWARDVDAAIICEPEDNQLCIAQKGALRAEINACGKMSHGAMPLSGLNPNPPIAKIIAELSRLERAEIETHGRDRWLGFPSLTPTVLQAPVAGEPQLNVMPSHGRVWLDIRTIPGQSHDALKAELNKIVDRVEAEVNGDLRTGFQGKIRRELYGDVPEGLKLSIDLDILEERVWTQTDRDESIVSAVDEAIRQVTGKEPVYNGVPGATDGTFLWEAGIPIVTTGAGDRSVPHQVDEWVEIDQLVETAKIYALSAIKFLR